jgi:hypothetical protein
LKYSLSRQILACAAICGFLAVFYKDAAAQVVTGSLSEPVQISPQSLSVTYALSGCTLNVEALMTLDRSGLTDLRIELCSKTVPVDESCLMKFVEPVLASFEIFASGLSRPPDEDSYSLFIATRIFEKPRVNYITPPAVKITFDVAGVKECSEISSP